MGDVGQGDASEADSVSNVIFLAPFFAAKRTSSRQRRGGMPRLRQLLTTLLLTSSALDSAPVPPRVSMIQSADEAVMVVNIIRYQRTSQEFADRMSTNLEISPLINDMRAYFSDQGRRLVAIRRACTGMSQTDFADELEIVKSYLSELENNKKPIGLDLARVIKSRWHLPLDFILDGDIEMLDQAPARIVRKLEELAVA